MLSGAVYQHFRGMCFPSHLILSCLPWWWGWCVHLECRYTFSGLHSVGVLLENFSVICELLFHMQLMQQESFVCIYGNTFCSTFNNCTAEKSA